MCESFCTALTSTFKATAYAVDSVTRNDFNPTGWLPVRSWIYSGGDYVIAVAGDEFLIAERGGVTVRCHPATGLGFPSVHAAVSFAPWSTWLPVRPALG
jgi:hypothetical protein